MAAERAPRAGVTIVAGTFDLLHAGHFFMFHAAFHSAAAVEFWVTDDAMGAEKAARCGQRIRPWAARAAALGAWADA
jgi:phosphopantetheine adenylyltransferase